MNQIEKVNFAWLKVVRKQITHIYHKIHTREDILIQLYKNLKSKAGDLGRNQEGNNFALGLPFA